MSNCSNCKWDPDCVKYETLYPENCPDFELKFGGSDLISTSEVKYGKCPQCGESYQINDGPHFCPPKKRLPAWLKNEIISRMTLIKTIPDLDGQQHGNIQALEWVLSLEESK